MKIFDTAKKRFALILAGGVILAGAGAGAALATAPDVLFETNASGQTYGSLTEVDGRIVEPDLVKAEATNGVIGYVSNAELKESQGHPSNFRSPEAALKWQESRGASSTSVAVYESDGTTKVGQFVIGANNGKVVHEK